MDLVSYCVKSYATVIHISPIKNDKIRVSLVFSNTYTEEETYQPKTRNDVGTN